MTLRNFLKNKWDEIRGISTPVQEARKPVSKMITDTDTIIPVDLVEIFDLKEGDFIEFASDRKTGLIYATPVRSHPVASDPRVASETPEDDVEFEETTLERLGPPLPAVFQI